MLRVPDPLSEQSRRSQGRCLAIEASQRLPSQVSEVVPPGAAATCLFHERAAALAASLTLPVPVRSPLPTADCRRVHAE